MNYWIGVDTPAVFKDSEQKNDFNEPHPFGFPAGRRASVKKMRFGDRIINYMTESKVFFAVWEITEQYQHRPDYFLGNQLFSECVTVKRAVFLPPDRGLKFDSIKRDLSAFQKLKNPNRWSVLVRPSARKFKYERDGKLIFEALLREEDKFNQEFVSAASQEMARQRKLAEQAARPGQQEFSATLRRNYNGKCAITGCSTPAALEAAHIRVEMGTDDNNPENGLLLRSDIHALFDRHLITLSEDGTRVEVSDALTDPGYAFLRGAVVQRPLDGPRPSPNNILGRRSLFCQELARHADRKS